MSRLSDHLRVHSRDLEQVVYALCRLDSDIATPTLRTITGTLNTQPDLPDLIMHLSPHERISILNCLVKSVESPRSGPVHLFASNLIKTLLGQLDTESDIFDHRLVSLLLRSVCSLRVHTNSSSLMVCLDRWAYSGSSQQSWTPQSYAFFAYYLSELKPAITSIAKYPNVLRILRDGTAAVNLDQCTDQNLCNFAVGYCRLMKSIPNTLVMEIEKRDLSKPNLVFLLKGASSLVSVSLNKLSQSDLSWKDMVVITDVLTKHCGQDTLLSQHGTALQNLVDSLIESEGLESGFVGGQMLYVMSRLNYVPSQIRAPRMVYEYNAKTASAILLTIAKLGLREQVGDGFIDQRVDEVFRDGKGGDCALSVLSCCSSGMYDHAKRLLMRMMNTWPFDQLASIDKNQIMKSVYMLEAEGENELIDKSILWIKSIDCEVSKRPSPTNSSRSHKEVFKTLSSICDKGLIRTEVFVPNLSSFIDIQISEKM